MRHVLLTVRSLLLLAALSAVPACPQDLTLRIPPLTITASAIASASADAFHLKITADLLDLQDHITALLHAQLNHSDHCGERLSVERATLLPAPPASLLTAYVHYERWACVKLFGKESAQRLVGGNGVIPVTLTPALEANNRVKLAPEVGRIEADGSLGQALQTTALGNALRDKISASIQSALEKATSLTATLPAGFEQAASLQKVRFAIGDGGRLLLEVEGEVHLSASQIQELIRPIKAPAKNP